jgi:hypothetical protein
MRILTKLVGLGVAATVILAPAGAAQASTTSSGGGTVVVQQNGVTTHTVCASEDVFLKARGFPASQHVVRATVHIVGSGGLFAVDIPLRHGAGVVNTGNPGPPFVGLKFKVRYHNDSSDDRVAFGASILDC